eukprot:CAMPEP_0184523706 /NCGR_PEP_ID=MMETSP0198_2-20121128/9050_1 /TAXON_ID=1112570 /ORGANISM="Thraustochytrium sp., Strain LLF1b" /LENGTH=347 /DNA_ID=CAMNT_0026914801 /DNA_START=485 /DNA_END=1528 /DNA_ORIENTATION=+
MGEQLGKGSTAMCFTCVARDSGEGFAVKVIDKRRISLLYRGLLPQFRREVEILSALDHPNIIRLKEMYESPLLLHVVTELAHGGELFDYLVSQPNGMLTEASVSFFLRQCISAVAHMHEHNVIHRDIKLENILLESSPEGKEYHEIQLKIIDFGLSKSFEDAMRDKGQGFSLRTTTTFFGTAGYISPEMMKRKEYTQAVDVWSLGVVTFVLLCGVFPFDDGAKRTKRRMNYRIQYPAWVKNLSPSAKDLIRQLLEVNPKTRLSASEALVHPWVSGQTASPEQILSSPKHLPRLRSPMKIQAQLSNRTENDMDDANLLLSSVGIGGNLNEIVSPLSLEHGTPVKLRAT